MTPLAQAIANDACLPIAKRRFGNLANEIGLFDDLHFFECSAVYEASWPIAEKLALDRTNNARALAFLPAPRTMIEIAEPNSKVTQRQAILLEQDGHVARVSILVMAKADGLIAKVPVRLAVPLKGSGDPLGSYVLERAVDYEGLPASARAEAPDAMDRMASGIIALLAMINTPRVIGRRQHQPHAGLQRKLAAAHAIPGKYPHMAWTEIRLEVRPPRDASGEGAHETRLTGARAKHFVRCHLRIRLGMLELVTAHHRGNEALGIKQSRYVAAPPKDGVWPKWATAA